MRPNDGTVRTRLLRARPTAALSGCRCRRRFGRRGRRLRARRISPTAPTACHWSAVTVVGVAHRPDPPVLPSHQSGAPPPDNRPPPYHSDSDDDSHCLRNTYTHTIIYTQAHIHVVHNISSVIFFMPFAAYSSAANCINVSVRACVFASRTLSPTPSLSHTRRLCRLLLFGKYRSCVQPLCPAARALHTVQHLSVIHPPRLTHSTPIATRKFYP